MDKSTRRKLTALAKRAESLAADLHSLLEDAGGTTETEGLSAHPKQPVSVSLTELQGKPRDEVARLLDQMTSRHLGTILRELGGSSQDAKKPKEMLIDRILWRLFDFKAGHEILRTEKTPANNRPDLTGDPLRGSPKGQP